MTHSANLQTAVHAVAEACTVTREVQQELDQIRQLTKDDRSPVTVADFASQAIIAMRLSERLTEFKMVGEETASDLRKPDKQTLTAAVTEAVHTVFADVDVDSVLDAIDLGNHDASGEAYWTLDPIDGTKGFLRGGQYAVSLAYIERGVVRLGVLGCPNISADFDRPFDDPDPTGTLFYAVRGNGAHVLSLADIEASPVRIAAASGRALDAIRVCESVEAAHSKQDDTARIIAHLNAKSRPARLDSQCKYAVVARGQADAYLRLPTRAGYQEKIWDHAAGEIVATEAGAIVTDITGAALDYSRGATLSANRGIVCANRDLHGSLIAAIDALGLAGD